MSSANEALLAGLPIFSRLSAEDRAALSRVAEAKLYTKGQRLFNEGDPADHFHTIVRGRLKVFKETADGRDLILAILGPGDPVGAVAVYMDRPFPATAEALEDTVVVSITAPEFYRLAEGSASMLRGLLHGLTHRLMELTTRLATLTGGRVEPRFARLFVRLAEEMGREADGGVLVPLRLSRQELADMTGTTIETCIRIMSRWRKAAIVLTHDRGFLIADLSALREMAES